jgi:predicted glycosyltransferase
MKVLFDVTHPAMVHLFRHAIEELRSGGHSVHVTSREKDLTTQLLDEYAIAHTPLSAKGATKWSFLSEWAIRELRMLATVREIAPDVVVSQNSPPAVHAARLTGGTSIVFDDSEAERVAARLTHPFADVICTPANFARDLGAKQRRYDGYHELAYLHPDRFTPSRDVLEHHGVAVDEPYFVLRFVSWSAHHDVGQHGLSRRRKLTLVRALSEHGTVYVTSERALPAALEPYRLSIPPTAVHDLLFYADLYVGDSQTMATEASVLGTPAVRYNSFVGEADMSNFVELEAEYGLLYSTADERDAFETALGLATDSGAKARWRERRTHLLAEKSDVTQFMLETILAEGSA